MSFGKHCSRCHRDFHPSGFYAGHSWCKTCCNVYTKRYHRAQRRAQILRLVAR
jgi:hypothetical protein